jgi:hypothetical protein
MANENGTPLTTAWYRVPTSSMPGEGKAPTENEGLVCGDEGAEVLGAAEDGDDGAVAGDGLVGGPASPVGTPEN